MGCYIKTINGCNSSNSPLGFILGVIEPNSLGIKDQKGAKYKHVSSF